MLKEIFIENYKSLKNAKVEFKDGLNIIIGKNGSGKSNLLEFINNAVGTEIFFKYDFKNFRFPEYNFSYIFSYKDELEDKIELVVKLPSDQISNEQNLGKTIFISKKDSKGRVLNEQTVFSDSATYKLNNAIKLPKGAVSKGISEFTAVLFILQNINGLLSNYLKFGIPNDMFWLDDPNTISIDILNVITEPTNYENLFSYGFHYYLQNKLTNNFLDISDDNSFNRAKAFLLEAFDEYKEEVGVRNFLSTYSPIEDIKISDNVNIHNPSGKILLSNLTFDFKVDETWVPWNYLSDGTKRLFYIISQICCQNNGITLIEEPEVGIHPHQLFLLMNFIKEQSQYKQIIISTHSPMVLDILNSDELDRITIAKIENNNSKFYKLTEEQISLAKEYMQDVADLSDYWIHHDLENNDTEDKN